MGDSLIRILKKLDGKERMTIQSLMDELEVSKRTTHRYIETLQGAGFPICFNRQRSSYSFKDGFSLAKPDISIEESLALALSKKVLSNLYTGMEKSLASIESKLAVKSADVPQHIFLRAGGLPPHIHRHLGALDNAMRNYQTVEMTYCALHSGEETKRRVDPYYLFHQDDFWHLRGYCHLRGEFRTFALDRIKALIVLSRHFIPDQLSPEAELEGSFGTVVDGAPTVVELVFDEEIAPHVLRRQWHGSQRTKTLRDGRLEMAFTVNGYEGIKQWIYRWMPHVTVKKPAPLKKEIIGDLQKALLKIQSK